MSQHTPGPWVIQEQGADDYEPGGWYIEADAAGIDVCDMNMTNKQVMANARLIAKAPVMLAFITKIAARLAGDSQTEQGGWIREARALLKEIEG